MRKKLGPALGEGALWTDLNYSLLSWAILYKISEMADAETPDNRAGSVNDIPDSLVNQSSRLVDKNSISS
jgi:hypothetical protein